MKPETAALFEQIDQGYQQLTLALASITPEQSARPNVFGEWTAGDIVAHIIAWEEEGARVLRAINEGSYQRQKRDLDSWNAQAVAARRGAAWAELQHDLSVAHAALLALIHNLPETIWDDERATGWLRAVTTEHYTEHLGALQLLAGQTAQAQS